MKILICTHDGEVLVQENLDTDAMEALVGKCHPALTEQRLANGFAEAALGRFVLPERDRGERQRCINCGGCFRCESNCQGFKEEQS